MVAQALLLAVGISKEAWKHLPPEQKNKIKAQYEKGRVGMAKILTNRAKKLVPKKKPKKTAKKRKCR